MSAWRESATQQAQDDLDGLLDAALRLAQDRLEQAGEFFPFAMCVAASGDQVLAAADLPGERPASAEVVSALNEGLAAHAAENRACAVVADVRLPDGSDAIRVALEHREGVAMAVLLPYSAGQPGQRGEYGPLSAAASDRRIWE